MITQLDMFKSVTTSMVRLTKDGCYLIRMGIFDILTRCVPPYMANHNINNVQEMLVSLATISMNRAIMCAHT
jgi:hypothetical protein